jgi:hypothetical protein
VTAALQVRAKAASSLVQRPTLSPTLTAADMPKADKLAELSEDDADLVQVICFVVTISTHASLLSSPAPVLVRSGLQS